MNLGIEVSSPEGGLIQGTPEYDAHMARIKSLLDSGKVLVFERPHRIFTNVIIRRWAKKWELYPEMEADLVCEGGGVVALWDTKYKVHEFDTEAEAVAFVQQIE